MVSKSHSAPSHCSSIWQSLAPIRYPCRIFGLQYLFPKSIYQAIHCTSFMKGIAQSLHYYEIQEAVYMAWLMVQGAAKTGVVYKLV